jgi:hypothetical protein
MAFTATPGSFTPISIWAMLRAMINNNCPILVNAGPPTSGTSGTYAGQAGPGAILIDFTNGVLYVNNGLTTGSPSWVGVGLTTGDPGTALSQVELYKEVTAIPDNTATNILTITVPNAAHAAQIEFDITGRLGAGGAIGADEAVSVSKYLASVNRTPGVASVLVLGAQLGVAQSSVAGAATDTAVLTQVANGEGVTVTNTHTIKVTIARSAGTSANHKLDLHARLLNANASGITMV